MAESTAHLDDGEEVAVFMSQTMAEALVADRRRALQSRAGPYRQADSPRRWTRRPRR
ncbi:MAG TPA: hypothetical protein VK306_14630 [Acidimicrobiales bacterium]|nr:hypothetical protein [Acidimicrobiales bacterium]